MFSRELKKGSTELLILSLLESGPRHGYDLGKRIEQRSGGRLRLRIASLYPMLVRLESRGFIRGRWLERPGERRRRYYRLTPDGRRMLAEQRATWREFMAAVNAVVGRGHA
jgi:transcriptional regulator